MKNGGVEQDPSLRYQQQVNVTNRAAIDLSIEVVLLLVGGVFYLLFGVLLFLIDRGLLPYSEGSLYGLFVVLVSMQIITMGKTPFGDLLRSWVVVIIGLVTAMIGTLAIFFPGHLVLGIRILAGLIILVTGALGLVQLFTLKDKARLWMKVPGVLQQLTIACTLVYAIEVVLGIITLLPGTLSNLVTASLCLAFAISLFFLARCIDAAHRQYPQGEKRTPSATPQPGKRSCLFQEAPLTVANTFNTYQGCLMILLGFLILFNILGIFPSFNADGQIGLLLILTSLQLLALGQFVGSQLTRSWLVAVFGLFCAAVGIFSCITPGILTAIILPLLGLQNITTGVLLLFTQIIAPKIHGILHPPDNPVPPLPIITHLFAALTVTGVVTILFGINTLAPLFLPNLLGVVVYTILLPLLVVIMGVLSLILVSITHRLERGAAPVS